MTVERLNAASITSDVSASPRTLQPHCTHSLIACVSQSKLSMLTSQYAAVSGELTDIRERTIGWSSLPSTVDANTAAITEIIQDNQLLHEAVLTLTATAKATAAELASQKDGNLSLYVPQRSVSYTACNYCFYFAAVTSTRKLAVKLCPQIYSQSRRLL